MKTKIVMPAFSDPPLVERSVQSILKNTHHDFELIVVNNGLKELDATMEQFIDNPRVSYLVSEVNTGCGGGRNIGMRTLDNDFDYLFILDSDIYAPKDWDKHMVSFMEKNKRVGLAGPASNYAGTPQLIKNCPEFKTDEDIENYAIRVRQENRPHTILPQRWPVIGFCMIIRKEVYDQVGLFDEETFKLYGCEDNDYCWRTQQRGWQLAYIHNVFIYHHGHGGFNLLDSEGIERWTKNRENFKKKHGWL